MNHQKGIVRHSDFVTREQNNARNRSRPPINHTDGMPVVPSYHIRNGHSRGYAAAVTVDVDCKVLTFKRFEAISYINRQHIPCERIPVVVRQPRLSVIVDDVAVNVDVCGLVRFITNIKTT